MAVGPDRADDAVHAHFRRPPPPPAPPPGALPPPPRARPRGALPPRPAAHAGRPPVPPRPASPRGPRGPQRRALRAPEGEPRLGTSLPGGDLPPALPVVRCRRRRRRADK